MDRRQSVHPRVWRGFFTGNGAAVPVMSHDCDNRTARWQTAAVDGGTNCAILEKTSVTGTQRVRGGSCGSACSSRIRPKRHLGPQSDGAVSRSYRDGEEPGDRRRMVSTTGVLRGGRVELVRADRGVFPPARARGPEDQPGRPQSAHQRATASERFARLGRRRSVEAGARAVGKREPAFRGFAGVSVSGA